MKQITRRLMGLISLLILVALSGQSTFSTGGFRTASPVAAAGASMRFEVMAPFYSSFPQTVFDNGSYYFDTLAVDRDFLPIIELITIDIINDGTETLDFGLGGIGKTIRQIPPGVTSFIDDISGTLAPGESHRVFLDIQIDPGAQSGPYDVEISVTPHNAFSHRFRVFGTIEVLNCQANCPGPNIQVTDVDEIPVAGTYDVGPRPGEQQPIGFKIANIGDAELNNLNVTLSGDGRFSVTTPPTPAAVAPGADPSHFVITFDATNINVDSEYSTQVTVHSNAVNDPDVVFTLRVKKLFFPMRVEVGPFPLPAPVPIDSVNGIYDIEDVSVPPEPGLPGVRRVALRVFNLHNDNLYLSHFDAEFTEGGEGLTWQWNDPVPPLDSSQIKLHTGNGQTSGVFHFDGRFAIDPQAPPGDFVLEFRFKWKTTAGTGNPYHDHSFRIIGYVAEQKAEITPTQSSFPHATAPSFTIETGKANYYYAVEIALAKRLFDGGYGNRIDATNNRRNFYRSDFLQSDAQGDAAFTIPADVWSNFHGARIFYRVVTAQNADGSGSSLYSTPDNEWATAPAVEISGENWFGLPLNDVTSTGGPNAGVPAVSGSRLNTRALSSDYGPRNVTGGSKFHPGLDVPFGNLPPQPVYAIANGTVVHFGGTYNRIDINHGNYRTGYIHLSNDTLVSHGEEVLRGQLIGYSGSAGTSNHHLHVDSGNGVFRNVLRRMLYTDNHTLSAGPDTFIGDSNTHNQPVDVVQAAGNQHKALIVFGITTDQDKDLNYVNVRVDGGQSSEQSFELNYDAVTSQNSTSGVVTLQNGRTFRVRLFNDDIYGDANLGYDFYVKPADTGVNQVARDYFFFAWDTAPFQANDFAGPHLIEITLNNAWANNQAVRTLTIGPEIQAGAVQVNGTTVSQILTITNHDVQQGTISLNIKNLPPTWTATLSDPNPTIAANGSMQVMLTLTAPSPNAVLNQSARVVATFDRIPDLKDAVSLGLDMSVAQVVDGSEVTLADGGVMDLGYLSQTAPGGLVSRPVRIQNGSRNLDLAVAVQPVQSNGISTGGVTQLVIEPGAVGELTVFVAAANLGVKEAIITLSQAGVGSFSFTVQAEVVEPGAPPSQVPGFSATINGQNLSGLSIDFTNPVVDFTWSHAQGLSGIQQYQIVLQPADGSGWLYSPQVAYPATAYALPTSNLAYGQTYSVHIRAQDGQGTWGPFTAGGAFTIAAPTPPAVPNFQATINGFDLDGLTIGQTNPTIEFQWAHPTDPSGIKRYQIVLQPTDGTGWLYQPHILYPATTHSLQTSDLSFGKSYSVRIRAKNNAGVWGPFVLGGVFTVEEPVPPPAVPGFYGTIGGINLNGLTIDQTDPTVNFHWNHPQDPFGIERYQIVLQPTDGSGWLYSPLVLYPATSHTLNTSGLQYGMSYSVHIRAKNQAGVWGSFVGAGAFTVNGKPNKVPGFGGTINGANLDGLTIYETNPTVLFQWNHASHPSGIERYQIVLQPTDGSGWLYSPQILYPATSYTLNTANLTFGKSYSIHIRARSNAGFWGPFIRGGIFTVEAPTAPSAVPNFYGTINGTNLNGLTVYTTNPAITFHWNHASHQSGIERYQIVVQPTTGGWLYSPHVLYPATSHTLNTTNLQSGVSYSIHIRAKNNLGLWGPFVQGGTFTVQAAPGTVPGFYGTINNVNLAGLTIYETNPTVVFHWNHAGHPTGIERYQLVLQSTDGTGWLYSPHALYPASSYTLNTSNLQAGKSYSIHIRAKSNAGVWGPFSAGGTFTISAPTPPGSVPGFYGRIDGANLNGLTVNYQNPAVTLYWNHASHSSGIERYQVILQPTNGSGWLYQPHVLYPATSHTIYTSNLQYGMSYSIHIRAKNNLGLWGPFVAGGTFTVQQGPPSTVPGFYGTINGANLSGLIITSQNPTVKFYWNHASHPSGINRYQIVLQPTTGGWLYQPHILYPATFYQLNTSGLQYGKSYSIHIRAMSNEGIWGPFVPGGTFSVQAP